MAKASPVWTEMTNVLVDRVTPTDTPAVAMGSSPRWECSDCAADRAFLLSTVRPDYEEGDAAVRLVDLFAGGGGLSLGLAEAAHRLGLELEIPLAVEEVDSAADVYALNFPKAGLARGDVCSLFDGALGARLSTREQRLVRETGRVDVLVGGPPCQGHSDLNNYTRRRDPRNVLYLRMVRAAEIFHPSVILIENVPAVRHDTHQVVQRAAALLSSRGYAVADQVLDLVRFGVPQRRKRHILLAVADHIIDPAVLLTSHSPCATHRERTVDWAVQDLADLSNRSGWDTTATPTVVNQARMQWLIDHDAVDLPNALRPPCHRDRTHSYKSMYGRLVWDQPAPTITTGFGSPGQGRFIHPTAARTLTPHEAARLQTLPDFFDLDATKSRTTWSMIVGNAVPPLLGVHLMEPLLCAMRTRLMAETMAPEPSDSATQTGPPASSAAIRDRMRTTKRRDTGPELRLRSALHKMGLRFRVDTAVLGRRRRTDIVFPTERVAVYVDGCFWHGCPEHSTIPKQNRQWWMDKLVANKARDANTDHQLQSSGWTVVRVWEHQPAAAAAVEIRRIVLQRRWQ